jgi:hypothetical protein
MISLCHSHNCVTLRDNLFQLLSMDVWPSSPRHLDLRSSHVRWEFAIQGSHFQLVVSYPNQQLRTVKLHESYIPALACFDLEYWKVILARPEPNDVRKIELMITYMQNMRQATTDAIVGGDQDRLQDGSWKMDILHQWSIRTWSRFSHSEWGRKEYLDSCEQKNITPYRLELSDQSE